MRQRSTATLGGLLRLFVVFFGVSALLLLTSLFGCAALRIPSRFTPCFLLIRGLRFTFLAVFRYAPLLFMRPVPPRPRRYAPAFGEEEERERERRRKASGRRRQGLYRKFMFCFLGGFWPRPLARLGVGRGEQPPGARVCQLPHRNGLPRQVISRRVAAMARRPPHHAQQRRHIAAAQQHRPLASVAGVAL